MRAVMSLSLEIFSVIIEGRPVTWIRRSALPGHRVGCKFVVSDRNVLFGRRPCGRLQPTTSRRSQSCRVRLGATSSSLVQLIELATLSVDLPVAGFVGADSLQFARALQFGDGAADGAQVFAEAVR